jgi:hydroxymethylglutaryl-CoA reductase (NADPH)
MNLVTPLSPPRYNTHTLSSRKVDITTPGIRTVLTSLAQSEVPSADQDTDLFVKISAPIYLRVVPPPSLTASSTSATPASDILENFMSSWTRLVGDPVLSKWIVIVLAMSVTLNGYLLKGIALGLAGKGKVFGWDQKIESIVAPAAIVPEGRRPAFSLQTVNSRLKKARPPPFVTPPSSASEPSTPDSETDDAPLSDSHQVRPLEQLIDIFENGPKPSSVALELLNDEEVILLAQNGKIAAYALEKVLGNLERAVKIRRALICMSIMLSHSAGNQLTLFDTPSTSVQHKVSGRLSGAHEGL